jgi:hypothetical protein
MSLADGALLIWVVVSILLMMDRNSARGFSIAVIASQMLLPSGTLHIARLPDLNKMSVAFIGVLIGTILFQSHTISRLRFRWYDSLLLLALGFGVATSVVNGLGVWDGITTVSRLILSLVLPVFLARVHLSTFEGLRSFALVLIWAGVLYTPLVVFEFRMSPQLHKMVYGHFQHMFAQAPRWGFWRPFVFFSHALTLGRFMALSAFLAMFPMRKYLAARYGSVGSLLFLAPLLNLLLSMSLGPYLFFIIISGSYFAATRMASLAMLMPVGAVIWITVSLMGIQPLWPVVDLVDSVNPARARSLGYRLRAVDEYRSSIFQQPLYGHGRWGRGRIEGRATDSVFLTQAISRGLIGVALTFGWYFFAGWSGVRATRRARGTPYFDVVCGFAMLTPLALAITFVDNALDPHVAIAASAVAGVSVWLPRAIAHQRQHVARVHAMMQGEAAPQRPAHAARVSLHAAQRREAGR